MFIKKSKRKRKKGQKKNHIFYAPLGKEKTKYVSYIQTEGKKGKKKEKVKTRKYRRTGDNYSHNSTVNFKKDRDRKRKKENTLSKHIS